MSMTKQDIIDQSLHTGIAVAVLSLALHGGVIGGGLAGLACGLIRETARAPGPLTWAGVKAQLSKRGAQIDLAFWTIGGLAAGLI